MHLNLARKWRSKHFDELVGQPLVVRLVKNSLYRNLIFPVYLLCGTRGCGKTSIGRIFAAALNCQALEQFQKNPQEQQIPCLTCASCQAMQASKHPDFIEIDAASHTGVDNIRAIIDAAAFVPVLGRKKIYLIDEAHMLSKAAFNAFLKILEEPPISVVFMLATTDPHKIIETVTSRCFQLFFEPIEVREVVDHLIRICTAEEISFEKEALTLIAQETEGSMRDALNLVERIRIAYPTITRVSVIELLGKIDDDRLCELLHVVIQGSAHDVLATIRHTNLNDYSPPLVWKSFVELIRQAVWVKNGVIPDDGDSALRMKEITNECSIGRLIRLFEICYDYELAFAKTATPACMLEMMLLKMAEKNENAESVPLKKAESNVPARNEAVKNVNTHGPIVKGNVLPGDVLSPWDQCLQEIEKLNDPLVVSIFRQGIPHAYDPQTKNLAITFSQDLLFFKEWLENTQKIWQPTIIRFFGEDTQLVPHFTGPAKERARKDFVESAPVQEPVERTAPVKKVTSQPRKERVPAESVVTITDPEKWQKAHALLRMFPGTLMVSQESADGEGV